jgi:GABA(A) receptor-associated protein
MSEQEKLASLLQRYPDRVPVLMDRERDSKLPPISQKKILVPGDFTVAQFTTNVVKKHNLVDFNGALLVTTIDSIPGRSETMRQVYERHRSKDGILRLIYRQENIFGGTRVVAEGNP